MAKNKEAPEDLLDIAVVGDITDREAEICDKLLAVPPGGECTMYFDSPGGSAYTAVSLLTLIVIRELRVTGIVTGECSSAALWPLAACCRRIVTPFSVLLFHPLKWQSEEHIGLSEAAEWARHFGKLEKDMDKLLAQYFGTEESRIAEWMTPGRYVTGTEMVAAGLAEMLDLSALANRSAATGASRRASAPGPVSGKAIGRNRHGGP